MPSSVSAEAAPAVWAGLSRLRSISRLVLASIEQDDLAQVQMLARESETILASLQAWQEAHGPLPGEARELLDGIRLGNGRIVALLEEQLRRTAEELLRTRSARSKLRAARLPEGVPATSMLDRET